MTLYIKNMVCDRCRMVVRKTMEDLGLHPQRVELGEVDVAEEAADLGLLRDRLEAVGFELLEDRRDQTVSRIKRLLFDYLDLQDNARTNVSDYLAEGLNRDYSALSKLFSESEGTTIEQYFIRLKIEKVKEWLTYSEWSLSEIAYKLGYSSVAHLSNQFKKVTGQTPTQFRQSPAQARRVALDQV
jgi:AraC family transcriptional regulator